MSDPRYKPPETDEELPRLEGEIQSWKKAADILELFFNFLPILGPIAIFSFLASRQFDINIGLFSATIISSIFLLSALWTVIHLRLKALLKRQSETSHDNEWQIPR